MASGSRLLVSMRSLSLHHHGRHNVALIQQIKFCDGHPHNTWARLFSSAQVRLAEIKTSNEKVIPDGTQSRTEQKAEIPAATPTNPIEKMAAPIKQRGIESLVSLNIEEIKTKKYRGLIQAPEDLKHFRAPRAPTALEFADPTVIPVARDSARDDYSFEHAIWSEDEVNNVKITHKQPKGFIDHFALTSVNMLKYGFDILSGFNKRTRDERVWLNRIAFLETVAAVPGMVAAMVRHLHSLRRMRSDHGWIHTLLEEAENERMHLMTVMQLKNPTFLFRLGVMATQGIMVTYMSIMYLLTPKYCHRFVGYLEEEAVKTYTKCLQDIDDGPMKQWQSQLAPPIAITYWKLDEKATMRDVILAIRCDESHHRVVNHTLASMKPDDFNPYKPK